MTAKDGRSGPLVFVTVRHEIVDAERRSRCTEEHDIVYRDAAARPASAGARRRARRATRRSRATVVPDDVLLFRYSALTFNGHRIHYDRRYVTEVEGYPGLVVHGPLIATLLLDLLRRERADATRRALRVQGACARCSTSHPFERLRPRRRRAPASRCGRATTTAGSRCRRRRRSPDARDTRAAGRRRSPTATRTSATPCARCARSFPTSTSARSTRERGYPEAFVDALTKAGWLAALIPQEYGGSGLGLAEASVIMEEINRSGGNSGACHGQMYNMGTLLRHGSRGAEAALPAEDRERRAAPAVDGRDRAERPAPTRRRSGRPPCRRGDRYVVNGQKVWISRVQHSDLMILLARTTPLAEVKKKTEGMSIFMVDLRDADRPRHDRAADRQHGQPRDQRAVLRQPRDPGREPDRRGRPGLPVHPRRPQCRAHADRRRMHRRRLLVHRPRHRVREASASSSAGRSGRTRACSSRSPRPTSRSRRPT